MKQRVVSNVVAERAFHYVAINFIRDILAHFQSAILRMPARQMRLQKHIGKCAQRAVRRRGLRVGHVETGADATRFQLSNQGRLLDEHAARGIDQQSAVLERRKIARVQHMAAVLVRRRVKRNDVAQRKHFVQLHFGHTKRLGFERAEKRI